MRIQTSINKAAYGENNKEDNKDNADYNIKVKEFEQSLHIVKVKGHQYFHQKEDFSSIRNMAY